MTEIVRWWWRLHTPACHDVGDRKHRPPMLTIPRPTYTLFEGSLFRCTADEAFLKRFYDIFLTSDPGVAALFDGVDMKRQRSVLRGSLYLVARAAGGFSDGMEHLQRIAQGHGQRGLKINATFYDLWLDALLRAVRQTDPRFDEHIYEAWEACLRPCIAVMTSQAPR